MDAYMDDETMLKMGAWTLLNVVDSLDELVVHRHRGVEVGLKSIIGCSSFIQAAKDKAQEALALMEPAAP